MAIHWFYVVALVLGLGSCASVPGPQVREGVDYGRDHRGVWVRGSWEMISPSAEMDDVIDQLCPAVMQLPGARGHDDGIEYCGLLYLGSDGLFHASVPSRLAGKGQTATSRTKTCRMPQVADDPAGVRRIDADFHSHPWPGSSITS